MDHVQPVLQPAVRSGAAPRDYFQVIKPGIVAGNLLSAAAGFMLASGSQPDWRLLAATLAGVALVIASLTAFLRLGSKKRPSDGPR